MQSSPSFIGRLLSRLSLIQKFLLISLIFALSLIFAIFKMLSLQNQEIEIASREILGNKYERLIRSVYENIALHRNEMNNYMIGKRDKTTLSRLEEEINTLFQNLINYDSQVEDQLYTKSVDFEKHDSRNLKPDVLLQKWNHLLQSIPNITKHESNTLHLELLEDLQSLILYITETSELLQDPQINNYYLIHTLYWLLSENLKSIPTINIEYEHFQEDKVINPPYAEQEKNKIHDWLVILEMHLSEIKENIDKIIFYQKNFENNYDIEKKLQGPLQELSIAYEKYIQTVEDHLNNNQLGIPPNIPFNDIKNAYVQNFALSSAISEILQKGLENRLSELKKDRWMSVGLTTLIALAAFALGVAVMKSITHPLQQMMKAAIELGDGDLSVRVPVVYDDEVGKVSQAFNKTADSLQDLLKQLQWAGIQLTTSTTEIAATAKQQEVTVVEQESTTKQIAVTAREISATTKNFAKTMKEISETAENTSSLATSGKEGLLQMESTMRQMVEAAANIAAKLSVLNEKASTITNVVTTIAKVADQTNLLSLNAAIEAEKAGEQGRSFAVIAREIRRLADQTANATLDIEKMVNEMVSAVSAGVMGVDKFSDEINTGVSQVTTAGEQLSKIIEQVQQLTGSFESVNEGMQAQFTGAEQINESILQLSETAQQTSESIRQFHKSIEQLNHAAQELQSMVSRVKK